MEDLQSFIFLGKKVRVARKQSFLFRWYLAYTRTHIRLEQDSPNKLYARKKIKSKNKRIKSKRAINAQFPCIGTQVSSNRTKNLLAQFVQLEMYQSYNNK